MDGVSLSGNAIPLFPMPFADPRGFVRPMRTPRAGSGPGTNHKKPSGPTRLPDRPNASLPAIIGRPVPIGNCRSCGRPESPDRMPSPPNGGGLTRLLRAVSSTLGRMRDFVPSFSFRRKCIRRFSVSMPESRRRGSKRTVNHPSRANCGKHSSVELSPQSIARRLPGALPARPEGKSTTGSGFFRDAIKSTPIGPTVPP
jgi:hypothetical protein